MTLKHLKIFVAVCETGSATAAGEKLYIAQPSISLAISELEDYYGIKLFDRIGKRLHITEAGKSFLQYATHIVGLFEDMEKGIKNFDAMGIIRIGTSITIGNCLLPGYITRFKQAHPQMDVKVIIDNSERIQHYILSNKIDIGLIEGAVHSSYIIEHRFRDDELVMICGNDHPFAYRKNVEISELQKESLILREEGSAGREIFDSTMTMHGLEVFPAWESISTQAIIRAVQANLGISVLPYLLVKDSLERKEISQFYINGIQFKRSFSVIYHKNKFLTESAKDFIALCR
ncbi:LysR family transcriptional regulator [Clostridium thermosuccinogenes]|jgi:DNA-binding transcriptional LysR family regulator|uniref:LysR family transcriptional regulator n=1 Tax=Clostridium thermosuccinogenes TaxID=84032 RepID=A0A2K2F051_9CLOT|nr:LysR family transcriptional regulator [Pseudoclostridium thermosuccinogenes]AUS97199.1 LysR family transcriptional regulator [Pseudoclostridium thermosuccinogenes]PNT92132.1 LysR family transcriptional regulator [Pseudoclostridium thermosuccinogenes]PNT95942.1 LysR family transcriptional regulator [Pseudoclostridium thermosuccinogenes]PNT97330.1 LysR family transcriptional regulator [Pseudoclostridium thermosuccinogenes]